MPSEITHAQLAQAVTELAKDITRDAEQIANAARDIGIEAWDASRIAQTIGALSVDTATVTETAELAKILDGLEAGATAYAAAGHHAVRCADAVREQNRASHTGIGEAANRSPVGRQIYDVDRGWLRQE
ncbi:hypothetical protein [Streptomyces osmaniensis]|uniref:Excreted virulence factor EspC (Type VII ESX diderm) n=1 Tax=Streptomyces osmaniensis TaxID=593134 RepID=A0ABP6YY89_9ACTN|nr:hypothetical protein KJK32_47080 [Streptomyces sp. JCM17656]